MLQTDIFCFNESDFICKSHTNLMLREGHEIFRTDTIRCTEKKSSTD